MSDIKINNKNIKKINKLITPKQLKETMPCDEETKTFILNTRDAVENIIKKKTQENYLLLVHVLFTI